MALTRERFYNEAIRPNLARFSSTVKVRDILPHLPCLTLTDKEEVEAKRETSGNFTAMQTLLDNLRRRERWPDEFITALQNCEHRELASEMSATYDRIRGITNNAATAAPAPPAPRPAPAPAASYTSSGSSTTTTTVTVHAVPATAPPLPIPPSGAAPERLTAPSNNADPEPSPTPVSAPSPEPVSQAEIAPPVVAPSQPPPPPEVSVSKVSLPVPTFTGAAENKTPALDKSDGLALTDQTTISLSTGEAIPSTSSAQTSSSDTSAFQSQITQPYTTSQTSPKSKKTQVPAADKDIDTSERLPVQDTNPPVRTEMMFQEPEEITDTTANEVVQQNNTIGLPVFQTAPTNFTRTAQATSSSPAEVHSTIEQEYFSKPGVLQHPEPQQNRAEILPVVQEEPCSVVTGDLEISAATVSSTEPGQSSRLADQNSRDSATQSLQDPPYNAAALIHNQPEEDHYESLYHTQVNEIQYSEEPSAENMNGQPPSILQHRVISVDQHTPNDVGTKSAVPLSDPSGHDSKKSTTSSVQEEESSAARAEQREEERPELFRINNVHLFAAAGIGLSAAFLAWKFAHK